MSRRGTNFEYILSAQCESKHQRTWRGETIIRVYVEQWTEQDLDLKPWLCCTMFVDVEYLVIDKESRDKLQNANRNCTLALMGFSTGGLWHAFWENHHQPIYFE